MKNKVLFLLSLMSIVTLFSCEKPPEKSFDMTVFENPDSLQTKKLVTDSVVSVSKPTVVTVDSVITDNPVVPVLNGVKYIRFNSYYSEDNGQVNVYEIQAFSQGENVALHKSGVASSYEKYKNDVTQLYESSTWETNGNKVLDNDFGSRWSSDRDVAIPTIDNPQFIVVNLENVYSVDSIKINLSLADWDEHKQTFDISVSTDSVNWTVIGRGDNVTGEFKFYPPYNSINN